MGVSARPRPGTGRKTSSWCSCDEPPLMAPPTRFAFLASSSCGPSTRRAMMRDPKPGASALDPFLHPVGETLAVAGVPPTRDAAVTGVATGVLRDVGVGPHRLGADRRAARVGGGHLPREQERPGRDRASGHLAERLGHVLDGVCDVDRAGGVRRLRRPRNRPVERPVDLDRAGIELEGAHRAHRARGQVLGPDQPAVQVNDADIGQDGVPGDDPLAAGEEHGRGPAVDRLDPGHLRVTPHLAAAGDHPARQRLSQTAGAADGDGEAHGLGEHAHQDPHQAGARCRQGDVGVAGVARQQGARRLAPEARGAHVGGRGEQQLDEVEATDRPQPGQGAQTVADRRERREQGADQLVADPVPERAQLQPRLAVAGLLLLHQAGGHVPVAMDEAPAAVREGMPQHGGGVGPGQAVVLEVGTP